uniref:YtxH domain-containing protein n=1 Tax=Roseihalotalea indica TaxID=2867963 RepID=A0AA49GNN7_9BACT|nr:YtxH domain-containing protein [Tunicatimonas sp. TK19036]
MDNSGKTLVAFLLGAIAGTMAGLLVAPNSGQKTRKRLNKSANDVLYDLEDAWEESAERIKDLADSAVDELEKYSKKLMQK